MILSELFQRLSYGELSNLAVSGEGSGSILEAHHPRLIQYANEVLLRLHSRFVLKEGDLIIEMVGHVTSYHLRPEFAESANSEVPYPYIKDLPDEPFLGDVIKILSVHDSLGNERVLNDVGRADSLFTPAPDTLQVPSPIEGQALSVMYQARHEKLATRTLRDGEDLLGQVINLPFYLEGALQAGIAAKVFSHMNGQENILKSQEYAAEYERICADVEIRDLVNQTYQTSHTKLEDRGFV